VTETGTGHLRLQPWLALLPMVVAALTSLLGAGTTAASAATFTYDVPTVARVEVQQVHVDGLRTVLLSDARRRGAAPRLTEAKGTSTTPLVVVNSTNLADEALGTAKPWDLQRTETLAGRASQSRVDEIADSMRQNGWVGDPIEVFQANGQNYIVNGHHRVAAARQAGIDFQYRAITEAELLGYYPGGVSQLVSAASEARPGRVR
jgi:hypothetical protein